MESIYIENDMIISDPCYYLESDYLPSLVIKKVKSGEWIVVGDELETGLQKSITLYHGSLSADIEDWRFKKIYNILMEDYHSRDWGMLLSECDFIKNMKNGIFSSDQPTDSGYIMMSDSSVIMDYSDINNIVSEYEREPHISCSNFVLVSAGYGNGQYDTEVIMDENGTVEAIRMIFVNNRQEQAGVRHDFYCPFRCKAHCEKCLKSKMDCVCCPECDEPDCSCEGDNDV